MITKELALTLHHGQELWHISRTNADGSPVRARVNGRCKTWKRQPERFQLPMVHGLKNYFFYITSDEYAMSMSHPNMWALPERWEIEKHWRP